MNDPDYPGRDEPKKFIRPFDSGAHTFFQFLAVVNCRRTAQAPPNSVRPYEDRFKVIEKQGVAAQTCRSPQNIKSMRQHTNTSL
tara:strand:+ start:2090 stop:2341 length:252 start_codon:yes stop_codon:yes gene_type:complete